MPKVSEAYTNARRAEIIETAKGLFATNGFRATQMRDVAEGVGLSTGAIYRYFASKEDLVRAVVADLQAGEDALRDQVLGEGRAIERLERLPSELVRRSGSELQSRRNFRDYGEAAMIPLLEEGLSEVVRRGVASLQAVVEEAQADGDLKPELDSRMTASVISTLIIAIRFARLFGGPVDEAALTKTLEAMIAGLKV